jgi:hypothetical protein
MPLVTENVSCAACGGSRKVFCFSCSSGQVTCTKCSGGGRVWSNNQWENCWNCSGSGRVRCSACSGEGRIMCAACHGQGTISVPRWQD